MDLPLGMVSSELSVVEGEGFVDERLEGRIGRLSMEESSESAALLWVSDGSGDPGLSARSSSDTFR